jgi:N-acetylneuraminic acid mutarotase
MRQMGQHRRPSAAQRRVYLRRQIVAGVIVVAIIAIPIYLLRGGGGKGNSVGTGHTSTTSQQTTTTVPLQLSVTATTWHLPIPLSRSVVLPINTNLGVFGGLTGTTSSKAIYQIDPTTGIATNVGSMASAVHDSSGAVISGNYFVFGGGGTTETAAVQQFTFSNSAKLAASIAGTLPAKRADSASATFNGQYYLAGGFDGKKWLPDVIATTDGVTFNSIAQLPTPVRYPAVAALNGKLYIIGGETSPSSADATTVQQVDLQTMAVTTLSPLPAGLSHASAAVLNGAIYVFGGRSGGHAIATVSLFNTTTGQLQPVTQLPAARSDMGAAVVGQTVYLVGGEGDNAKPVTGVMAARLVTPGSVTPASSVP